MSELVAACMPLKVPPIPAEAIQHNFHGSVIIIGSGAAGLTAGNVLRHLGIDDFVVFEASNQVGGRVRGAPSDFWQDTDKQQKEEEEMPILDVGAEWIHAPVGRRINDLLINRAPNDTDKHDTNDNDLMDYHPETWQFGKSRWDCMRFLYSETKFNKGSWSKWLDENLYNPVQDKVKLSSPVAEIHYDKDKSGVTVIMADGAVHCADKVICTIPLAVLKSGDILFVPPLPDCKQKAIHAMDMPPGLKVFFEMKEKFYPDITSMDTLCTMLASGVNDVSLAVDALLGKDCSADRHVLEFIAVGNKSAAELGRMEEEELVKAVLGKLDAVFEGQASKNYIKHVVQNWTTEPYILGSYACIGTAGQRKVISKGLDGKIFFAGEHTHAIYPNTVHGAALSGRRAAVEAVLC